MKYCEAHKARYRHHCAECLNKERAEVQLEQAAREQARKEAIASKDETTGFFSRQFFRKKDKKRDFQTQ